MVMFLARVLAGFLIWTVLRTLTSEPLRMVREIDIIAFMDNNKGTDILVFMVWIW